MPIVPRMDRAKPMDVGGRPTPPVKMNGSFRSSASATAGGLLGSYTGVDRKMNHSELKVPTWKASSEWASSVSTTLRVKMRRKGRRCV